MALLSRKTDCLIEPIVAESTDADRAVEELTRLQKMSAALVGCPDLGSIVGRVVEGAAEGLEADRAIVFRLDDRGTTLTAVACGPEEWLSEASRRKILNLELPVGTTDPLSASVQARGPYLGTEAAPSDQSPGDMGSWLAATLGTHHVNVAPLMVGERVLGLLTLDNHVKNRPLGCRPALLMAYAGVTALAIERASRNGSAEAPGMQLLSSVVSNSADAIFHVNLEEKIASWNRGAERIFGYAREEIVGRPYPSLIPHDRLEEYLSEIKERVRKEGRLTDFETERLGKDGRRIPVSMTLSRLDGIGVSAIVRDITDRKREQDQHRLLSSITKQSFDAILSTDREGMITSWNDGAERIFGYRPEDIVGRHWLDLAPADREEEFRAIVRRPLPEKETNGFRLRTLDSVARAADGRLVPVKISVSVLRDDEDGEEAGWSVIFRDLTEQRTLAEISERLQQELHSRNRLEGIVGNSAAIEDVRDRIRRVARFNSSVLVAGQSGTGKELVANAIHYNSPRAKNPFVKVNCAAIPEDLLESELFGIERNVATGVDGRIGRFEMAAGGTLFLDEIGDMSLSTQAKILRVLQEREFERVGGKKVIKVDVRIIAATNKDLEAEIRARRFRVDLFYRLNVIVIALPALAGRREDIDPLIDHFLARFAESNDLPRKEVSLEARLLLNRYAWPGNVRELEHCIERAVVMSEGSVIGENDLPPSILIWRDLGGTRPHTEPRTLQDVLYQVERSTVRKALERCDWVQARAARMLGISERSMWYRVKKLGLKRPTR